MMFDLSETLDDCELQTPVGKNKSARRAISVRPRFRTAATDADGMARTH